MKQPAVGVICHFPPPPGGMPVQAQALVAGLRSSGFDALPIATNLGWTSPLGRLDNVRIIRTFLRSFVFFFRLLRALPQVSVLHINTCSGIYFFLFAAPSIVLGRLTTKRVVLHYHSGNAPGFFRQCGPIVPWLLRLVDSIVAPSEYLHEVFRKLGFDSTIVPNILELDHFAARSPALPAPVFIVARNLEPIYGIDTILRALPAIVERYPATHVTILGTGTERERLETLARTLGLTAAVTFTGAVDNSCIPEWFARASIFLNASLSDNQPVSILEAFAAELPVITSDVGGIPCLVRHGETGLLFPVGDAQALSDAIVTMLETPGLAETCTRAARLLAERYSWKCVFRQLAPVYGFERSTPAAAGSHSNAPISIEPR